MKVFPAMLAFAFAVWAVPVAFSDEPPDPEMGHCKNDSSVPAENIVASCEVYINEAYMQNWHIGYVPVALYYEALARQRQGKTSEAAKLARAAVKLEPAYFAPWRLLVALSGQVPASEADMKAVDVMIAANPGSAGVLNAACWERATRGQQLEAALADCNEAIRLDPNSEDAFDSRCFTRVKMGDFANAVADCDAALKLSPNMETSLYVKGIAELRLGFRDPGTAHIEQAKAIDPKIAETYASYGVTP